MKTRAHCLIRERRALSRRLARRQCCHRYYCRRSKRVVTLAAVHRRLRRDRSPTSLRVQKRRKCRRSTTCECPRRRHLDKLKPPPPLARAVPPLVLEPASEQQHLAPLRKKARVAVGIVDGIEQSQCSTTAYGGYSAAASATCERRKLSRSHEQANAPPDSITLSSSAATTQRVYCYAVASRGAQVQKNFGLLHIATSQENSCVALAPLATMQENQFKERVTE